MSAINPARLDTLPAKFDAVYSALQTTMALQSYVTKDQHLPLINQTESDLTRGVVMLLSAGEGSYRGGATMQGKEGIQQLVLIGHLKMDENTQTGADLRNAEFAMIEAWKSWVRSQPVSNLALALRDVQQSRQMEFPYGWCAAFLDAGPLTLLFPSRR